MGTQPGKVSCSPAARSRRPPIRIMASAYDLTKARACSVGTTAPGCHANGGGGIGPPLIKENWIYGGEPANLFDTIVKGRPNGMPAWGGRIPEYQIWQLVGYVRVAE